MVDEKRKEEELNTSFRFRAKEVPLHVKEPLYEKITKENDARRQQVKKDSVAMTL